MPTPTAPAVPAFMLSMLARKWAQAKAQFEGAYRTPWLLWEPGAWHAPDRADATLMSGMPAAPDVNSADALVFQLKAHQALKVGRFVSCDIVVNDATVSREHVILSPTGDDWRVRLASPNGNALLNQAPLSATEQALVPGTVLQLGSARLTYLSAEGFFDRLARFSKVPRVAKDV